MMRNLFLISLGLVLTFLCNDASAQSFVAGKVTDLNNQPLAGVSCRLLSLPDSVPVSIAATGSDGQFKLNANDSRECLLQLTYMGFETVNRECKTGTDIGTIVMKEASRQLNEVVVTPEIMQRYDSHNSYRLTNKDLARYPTFAQAMNVIPFVNVLADGTMTYRGKSDIVVLINGVKTTTAEVRALDKGDVMKVDVYENPPAQYALDGASAVVNIITKRRVTGGNVAVDLKDSFHPVKGTNNVSAFFNTGESRFSLLLGNEMNHYKKVITDESLNYELGGMEYSKTKQGLESPYNRDNNSLSLGFMTHKQDLWQFNANLSVSAYKLDRDLQQTISYSDRDGMSGGENRLYNRYSKQSLNLYFTKSWKNNRLLLADVTGTLFNTLYSSNYNEWNMQTLENTFKSLSAYKTDRRSLLSTLQYTMPGSLGSWTFGLKDTYQYGKQKQTDGNLIQNENTIYGYAQLYGRKDKFYYQLIAAAKYLNIRQNGRNVWSKWYPSPTLRLWLVPFKALTVQTGYSFTADVPAVSLMSQTEQWLDNHYVYRGNAGLSPYKTHQVWIMSSLVLKHFDVSLIGLFTRKPNAIINFFEKHGGYIMQSYTNMRFTNEAGGQLTVDLFPLKDKSLKLQVVGIYMHHRGKEKGGETWNGYRYQFMASVSYALRRWNFEAFYQYPGQTMEGQLVTPRAEVLTFDIDFKPNPDMSIGLQLNQPFMNGFKEGEHTTKTAIIQSDMMTNFKDWKNMVCLKFTYNLSFGKHIKAPSQKVENVDNDSGILVK